MTRFNASNFRLPFQEAGEGSESLQSPSDEAFSVALRKAQRLYDTAEDDLFDADDISALMQNSPHRSAEQATEDPSLKYELEDPDPM